MHCIILYFVATCKRSFGPLLLNKMNEWICSNRPHLYKRELLDTVKARKTAYYGHTMRKQVSCLENEIMQGTVPGARKRGRPRTAWTWVSSFHRRTLLQATYLRWNRHAVTFIPYFLQWCLSRLTLYGIPSCTHHLRNPGPKVRDVYPPTPVAHPEWVIAAR